MNATFRAMIAVISFLALASSSPAEVALEEARGNVIARATVNRNVIALSEDLTLELEAEGPARLTVAPPQPLLTKSSAQAWRIRDLGWPIVENLGNGRQRWTQSFRLSPFEIGTKVEIALAPLKVRAGAAPELQINWQSAFAIHVTTSIVDPDPQSLRPIAGIEKLLAPAEDANSKDWRMLRAIFLGIVFSLMVVLLFVRQRRKTKPAFVQDANWALSELHELGQSQTSTENAFAHIADILRQFLSHRFNFPATRLTSAEVLIEVRRSDPRGELDREDLQFILERCDLAKFAPRLNEDAELRDQDEWIDRAIRFVRRTTSIDQTDPRS